MIDLPKPEAIKRKSLAKFAEQNNLRSVLVFATAPGGIFHMAVFSKYAEQEDKMAQLANRVQKIMGWPENMALVPDRLAQLLERNRTLEAENAALIEKIKEKSV